MCATEVQDIVDVTISLQAAINSSAPFQDALVFADSITEFAGDYKEYLTQAAVLVDFASTSEVALATAALFAQDPSVDKVIVGKRADNVAQVDTVTVTAADLETTTTIDSTPYTVNVGGGTMTTISIATLITAAITADSAATVTAVDGLDGTFTVTSDVLGDPHTVAGTLNCTVVATTPNVSVATELLDFIDINNNWYALIVTKRTTEAEQLQDIRQAAAQLELLDAAGNRKIYGAANDEADMITSASTDIASVLQTADTEKTFIFYSTDDESYPEAAALGVMLPKDPGSYTLKFKTLAGITADTLTAGQASLLDGKACNYYLTIGGTDIVASEGVVSDWTSSNNKFVDNMIFRDWLIWTIATDMYAVLTSNDKVPMTNPGIGLIETTLTNSLQKGVNAGGIVEGTISVSVPDISEISEADRLARLLDNVTFAAQLSGAVHKTIIVGTLAP